MGGFRPCNGLGFKFGFRLWCDIHNLGIVAVIVGVSEVVFACASSSGGNTS